MNFTLGYYGYFVESITVYVTISQVEQIVITTDSCGPQRTLGNPKGAVAITCSSHDTLFSLTSADFAFSDQVDTFMFGACSVFFARVCLCQKCNKTNRSYVCDKISDF